MRKTKSIFTFAIATFLLFMCFGAGASTGGVAKDGCHWGKDENGNKTDRHFHAPKTRQEVGKCVEIGGVIYKIPGKYIAAEYQVIEFEQINSNLRKENEGLRADLIRVKSERRDLKRQARSANEVNRDLTDTLDLMREKLHSYTHEKPPCNRQLFAAQKAYEEDRWGDKYERLALYDLIRCLEL